MQNNFRYNLLSCAVSELASECVLDLKKKETDDKIKELQQQENKKTGE